MCEELLARKKVCLPFESLRARLLLAPDDLGRRPGADCWRAVFAYMERSRASRADASALDAVRLSLSPEQDAAAWVRGVVARRAFDLYACGSRFERFVLDRWRAVLVFSSVYRRLVQERAARGGAPVDVSETLPGFVSHSTGASRVAQHTGEVVFLDEPQRLAHRLALAAATWEAEMLSWRSLGRCARDRGGRHDLRRILDRPLTQFRFHALFAAYTLCPLCGLRSPRVNFGWPAPSSLSCSGFLAVPPVAGAFLKCRMHSDRGKHDYAVPDLLATVPIPGSHRLRWRYWPRYNEARGVFEELVTEENRWWQTFLDFSYEERRAMRVIGVFCDTRED